MIESILRSSYQKVCIDPLLKLKFLNRVHPIYATLAGCIAGVSVAPCLILQKPLLALVFLSLSGFLDTLDGSLARHHKRTSDVGAALDIFSDRVVEFAVILGLFWTDPAIRALPCLLVLGSILICITSFLIVGIFTQNGSQKSFHYSPGLIERAEAFLFFAAMIAFPTNMPLLSYVFSTLVAITACTRMLQFTTRGRTILP